MIRMFIYSAVIGISSSFGIFMFTAWLAIGFFAFLFMSAMATMT